MHHYGDGSYSPSFVFALRIIPRRIRVVTTRLVQSHLSASVCPVRAPTFECLDLDT